MADESQVAMLKRSVEEWNEWRRAEPSAPVLLNGSRFDGTKLRGANLGYANLRGAVLSGADLSESILTLARLDGARLRQTIFTGSMVNAAAFHTADLHGANMTRTNLMRAEFGGCDLSRARFAFANLTEALISGAVLENTDFSEARLYETIFADVDLSRSDGLSTCVHLGHSVLDHRTLSRSKNIPLTFLRGAGLPERLIEYLPSLLDDPLQFYSCFISYSTRDQSFADRLHADFQNQGVRCWFAVHDIVAGKKLHDQIDEAIKVYDRLLLILSEASMASEWVKTEIANARQKELAQGRQVLFPISIVPFEKVREWKAFDADTGKDSAREIREYYIPDFTGWDTNHTAYKAAFDKLLRGLKADDGAGART